MTTIKHLLAIWKVYEKLSGAMYLLCWLRQEGRSLFVTGIQDSV